MSFDHVYDRLRKIERTVTEMEHTLRSLGVKLQREISIHTSGLTEIKRAVTEVRTEVETLSGQKDPDEMLGRNHDYNPVDQARGAGII